MRKTKDSAHRVRRNRRKQFSRYAYRIFGLEHLEKRTVFASDLSPFVNELGACIASPEGEIRSAPSVDRTVEVARTPLSLLQGDVLRLEVPETILLQLTDRDTYELRVFYSENYFSYDSVAANGITAILAGQSGAIESTSGQDPFRQQTLSDQLQGQLQAVGDSPSTQVANNIASGNRTSSNGDFTSILLASLTASSDFEGQVRVFDSIEEPNLRAVNSEIAELPDEVRIEPLATVPTVMRDPGATLVKTIIVNRATKGLLISSNDHRPEAKSSNEMSDTMRVASDQSELRMETSESDNRSESKPSRSVVTLRTIDISAARRSDPSRPWMRSSSISNPTSRRESLRQESAIERTTTESTTIASTTSAKSDLESIRTVRRESRVASTKLEPVEFLLADTLADQDSLIAMDAGRIRAIDQAISSYDASQYAEDDSFETKRSWGDKDLLAAWISVSDQAVLKKSLTEGNPTSVWKRNEDSMFSPLDDWGRVPKQGGVASNKESWKNALRSVSESAAGQVLLASLTSLAVQHRDINAFGTKTAWEFVTKTVTISPV